jgi:two-component system sensor histidine kinase ChvG
MASVIDLPRNSPAPGADFAPGARRRTDGHDDLVLIWSRRWSLTQRILAINVFAVAMLLGSVLYLDSYRSRLIDERMENYATGAQVMAAALSTVAPDRRASLAAIIGHRSGERLRIYGADGRLEMDSWDMTGPTYRLRDPQEEPLRKHVARFLDRVIDAVAGTARPSPFVEPAVDRADRWPLVRQALATRSVATDVLLAPDRTPVFIAAIPLSDPSGSTLLLTENARDVITNLRAERFWSAIVLGGVIVVSILLSLFLARTIVRPLRRLAIAAHRVRLGRAREVTVPRLPSRRDEIGMLARALSDMSQALRARIDATEAFAADVTHELKNPLASLRSAVEALGRVKDEDLQKQLLRVVTDDVHRLDRLITDIAEASRVDAELSRVRFEPIDLGAMLSGMIAAREERGAPRGVQIAFARPEPGTALVMGEEFRLTRVVQNLIDNAISFSPDDGVVLISVTRDGDVVQLRVEDDGPGVAPEAREAIFRRFYSERTDDTAIGQHSGLGLAIAKTIVEAHDGRIAAEDRTDAPSGARFTVTLPSALRA